MFCLQHDAMIVHILHIANSKYFFNALILWKFQADLHHVVCNMDAM